MVLAIGGGVYHVRLHIRAWQFDGPERFGEIVNLKVQEDDANAQHFIRRPLRQELEKLGCTVTKRRGLREAWRGVVWREWRLSQSRELKDRAGTSTRTTV